jgi:exo-beta-1,3-glucanase (GH17 family)
VIGCFLIFISVGSKELSGGNLKVAKSKFAAKLEKLRWIAYSPSTFDPHSEEPLRRVDIEADLRKLKSAGFNGLVTYSCLPIPKDEGPQKRESAQSDAVGMDDLPEIARKLGFRGFIVGVWDPKNERELVAVGRLADAKLIDAICVGNEGLDVRYDWTMLRDVMRKLRASVSLPVTTTEQIEDYGLSALSNAEEVDWLFPNIHPVFQNSSNPRKAAEWTVFMASKLRELARDGQDRLPILIKETGWPTVGLEHHNEEAQKLFWESLDRLAKKELISYVTFEAFDQPWKHERVLGKDIGTSWGVFSVKRQAKLFIRTLSPLHPDEVGKRVNVWKDDDTVAVFVPSGWVPDGQGISLNTSETEAPHTKPHCLRIKCQLSAKPWVGVYFLLDGKWEPSHHFNLFEKLDAKKGDAIKCRFWARAKKPVAVQFKIGGVIKGKVKDSLIFPVSSKWIKLKPEWQMYEINLTGKEVSSVVGGFMWVVDRSHNGNKDVSFDLDTIYFVKTNQK